MSVVSTSVEDGTEAAEAEVGRELVPRRVGWERIETSSWRSPGEPRERRWNVFEREVEGARRPRETAVMIEEET